MAIDMANADYLFFFSMERTGAPLPTAGSGVPGVTFKVSHNHWSICFGQYAGYNHPRNFVTPECFLLKIFHIGLQYQICDYMDESMQNIEA